MIYIMRMLFASDVDPSATTIIEVISAHPPTTMMKWAFVLAACLAALCCTATAATTGETVMGYTFGSEIKGEHRGRRAGR